MLQDFATIIEQIDEPLTEDGLGSLEIIANYLERLVTDEMCCALLLYDTGDKGRANEFEELADKHISLLTNVRSWLELDMRDACESANRLC